MIKDAEIRLGLEKNCFGSSVLICGAVAWLIALNISKNSHMDRYSVKGVVL